MVTQHQPVWGWTLMTLYGVAMDVMKLLLCCSFQGLLNCCAHFQASKQCPVLDWLEIKRADDSMHAAHRKATHLAVHDVKVLVREEAQDFVDVLFSV